MKKLRIGLFGFGVVGEGIYKVLSEKLSLHTEVVKICIKDEGKERNAPGHLFSTNHATILEDPSINVIVELIDDADAAFQIVCQALKQGKSVVSANKRMIAENHAALIELQERYGASLLYEGAVCGSIPILRNLEEYFDNDLLQHVTGIVNGSTNYILTKMALDGGSLEKTLVKAQQQGFAESDPTLDVRGVDASYKLSIISLHAFGRRIDSQNILTKGIQSLQPNDLSYAAEKRLKVKLVARTWETTSGLCATVFPTFLSPENTLSIVDNEYNGVVIGSSLADEQFLYGKGAGRFPTSSAVLSDISALRYGYKYEYRKGQHLELPSQQGSGKFYVSCKKDQALDL